MVQIVGRKVEARHAEVLVETADGVFAFPKKVDSLKTTTQINPADYVLVQEGQEAKYALSAKQHLNGLAFEPMIRESFRLGLPLATVRDITAHHRNVNLALEGRGVLYDASGNLIDEERLIEVGNAVNRAWVYLNNAYEKGDGFLGLNIVQVVGFDGEKPVLEKQPLEECVVDCWADIQGTTNSQGYHIRKASVQKFAKGRTVYQSKPVAGYVAGLYAGSDVASLIGDMDPQVGNPSLGGILRAEGTAQKIFEEEK
jgi:hypothetical protein